MPRQLRYNIAVSLDGYIAPPDHSTSWIVHDTSIDFAGLYAQFDTFIMGRKTFDVLRSMGQGNPLRGWPKEKVHVVSSTLEGDDIGAEVTLVRGKVAAHVKGLLEGDKSRTHIGETGSEDGKHATDNEKAEEQKGAEDIWLYGGAALAAECFDAGLVSSLEVAVMPVLLRDGVKMLEAAKGSAKEPKLELQKVERLDSGILMCRYAVSYID